MISLPIYVIFLVFLVILLFMEHNRRHNNKQKRRIMTLQNDVSMLKKELDQLETLKSQMLSGIGTSLRKPLESVRETVIELSKPLGRTPEIQQQLARLSAEIAEIEKFLSIVKELSALEKMDLSSEPHEKGNGGEGMAILDEILLESLKEWNDAFSDTGISLALSLDDEVSVRGNPRYLRHAFDNIFSEIARVAESGSLVHIVLLSGDHSVKLTITHRGNRRSAEDVSAFGVELARQIVNAHNGWLTEDADTGRYSMEFPKTIQ